MKEIAKSNILDLKLTPKQQIILNALESAENTHKRVEDIAKEIGVSERYIYYLMTQKHFISAMQLRGITEFIRATIPISRRMVKDALGGKFMQQKTALEIAGIYQQTPLINVIINQNTAPAEDIDKEIINKIIDIEPEVPSV